MKQVVRRVIDKKGVVAVEEIPTPSMGDNQVLISTHYSLISSGTELATVDKNPVELAKQTLQDPWMRNAVKNLIFSGGLRQTLDTVANELTLFRIIGYRDRVLLSIKERMWRTLRSGTGWHLLLRDTPNRYVLMQITS
jgi:hypothetical protein